MAQMKIHQNLQGINRLLDQVKDSKSSFSGTIIFKISARDLKNIWKQPK